MCIRRFLPLPILVAALAAALAAAQAAQALEIRNARIPQAPDAAPVMAAYMDIRNADTDAVTLHGARSPEFSRVTLHETITDDDSTRMQAADAFVVPAGGTLRLAPRGKHLMLYDPPAGLRSGDEVALTFETSIGDIELVVPVTEPLGQDTDGHDEHH